MMRFLNGLKVNLLFLAFCMSALLIRVPTTAHILGLFDWATCHKTHWFAERYIRDFYPAYFLPFMQPFSRLASENVTAFGMDLKAGRHQLFGSMGRSMLIDRSLANYLLGQGMITIKEAMGPYDFSAPWRKEKLAELGIRYVVQTRYDPEMEEEGWRLLAQTGPLYLYENPEPTSVVYYLENGRRIPIPAEEIRFRGNGLSVRLRPSQEEREVVATFNARPGWTAALDGEKREIYTSENQMIRVRIPPLARELSLQYEPFHPLQFVLFAASSFFLLWAGWVFLAVRPEIQRSNL